ncbi:hypothetical protein EDD85DRAFT_1018394 [Armillaria nabsnona]|nr:hypothetical protein EDD85DRAFT_1018394 [Armillaria nabsnona]
MNRRLVRVLAASQICHGKVVELPDPLDIVHLASLSKTFQRVLIPGRLQGEGLDDSLGLFTVYRSPLRPSWFSSRSTISAMGHQQKHRRLLLRLVYARPVRHYIPSESLTLNVFWNMLRLRVRCW